MKTKTTTNTGSPALMAGTVLLVLAGTLACTTCRATRRAAMAEAISNARQIKLFMDSFAMDNDGAYPNAETAKDYKLTVDGFSNVYFRQLIASRNTNSEQIFWVRGASACSGKQPDNVTTKQGTFDPAETLKPGDCGWAYMTKQKNTSNPARPLLLDAYKVGTKEFDPELWGRKSSKVIVMHIDGSVRPMRIMKDGVAAGKVLDGDQTDILSKESKVWKESAEDPRQLLVQPKPS